MIVDYVIYIYITAKGVYREGKGAVPPSRPVWGGGVAPLGLRAFTLFKS